VLEYVTYIRTPVEELWRALTDPAVTVRYWFDARVESDWRVGAPVAIVAPDGAVWDHGEVLEVEPYRRLCFTWITLVPAELAGEPATRLGLTLEPIGPDVRLTVVHDGFEPGSKLYESVREGWPALLSTLKSLLETGSPLAIVRTMLAG